TTEPQSYDRLKPAWALDFRRRIQYDPRGLFNCLPPHLFPKYHPRRDTSVRPGIATTFEVLKRNEIEIALSGVRCVYSSTRKPAASGYFRRLFVSCYGDRNRANGTRGRGHGQPSNGHNGVGHTLNRSLAV